MKLNKIALGLAALATIPAANAGVTVTPLVGYHYTGEASEAQRELLKTGTWINQERKDNTAGEAVLQTTDHNSGVTKMSDLYTGVALGLELTPSTQFQIEYGVSNANAQSSQDTWDADRVQNAVGVDGQSTTNNNNGHAARYDAEQQMISGNFLIGLEQLTGYKPNGNFKPYALVGAGQSKLSIENQQTYSTEQATYTVTDKAGVTEDKNLIKHTHSGIGIDGSTVVPAGSEVAETIDTIGNLGLGAMYRVNDALSLRGEARAIHNFDNDWWEGMALAGLEVVLGGHLGQVEAPEPALPVVEEEPAVVIVDEVKPVDTDTDRDGVIDQKDACPGTPMNKVVDARGCPVKVSIDDALKMELRVFFDNDKSAIKDQYQPEIAKVAEKMREYPSSAARIEGHASKTGPSARYNQRLSEARAVAVKSMLANQFGVNPARLSTQGFGYDRPIAPNDTAEGRAMNRRVYAIITGNKRLTVDQTKDMVKK